MTTPEEARGFMLSKVGSGVFLIGTHPKCGHRGEAVRVEDINGEPCLIIRVENGVEYPITDPGQVMFVIQQPTTAPTSTPLPTPSPTCA